MNAKQQALYDRIVAAGGQMWIETTMTFFNGKGTKSTGRGDENVMDTLLDEKTRPYIPRNGFRREVKLKLLRDQKIEEHDYNDPKVWLTVTQRYLVEVIA